MSAAPSPLNPRSVVDLIEAAFERAYTDAVRAGHRKPWPDMHDYAALLAIEYTRGLGLRP